MRFLGIFEQFLIDKKSNFLTFFEMFSCISLLEDLILTISFNRKKLSGHNEKVDLRKETAFMSTKIFFLALFQCLKRAF